MICLKASKDYLPLMDVRLNYKTTRAGFRIFWPICAVCSAYLLEEGVGVRWGTYPAIQRYLEGEGVWRFRVPCSKRCYYLT